MSLINIMEDLTNRMNSLAGSVTSKGNEYSNKSGLDGLGALNRENLVANIKSQNSILTKNDTDIRKIPTMCNNSEEYINSMMNWAKNIDANATQSNGCIQFTIGTVGISMYPCINEDALNILLSNLGVSNDNKVIIGYFNISSNNKAKILNVNAYAIDIDGINEINKAVDDADKGIPYLTLEQNIKSTIAKELNTRYKKEFSLEGIVK